MSIPHTSSGASPEEPGFGVPVPGVRIQHVRCEDIRYYTSNVVEVSRKDDGFVAETGRRGFGDERVAGTKVNISGWKRAKSDVETHQTGPTVTP